MFPLKLQFKDKDFLLKINQTRYVWSDNSEELKILPINTVQEVHKKAPLR